MIILQIYVNRFIPLQLNRQLIALKFKIYKRFYKRFYKVSQP